MLTLLNLALFPHCWMSSDSRFSVLQCRVPFDVKGIEARDKDRVAQWRTYTEIGVAGHFLSVRGPVWLMGLVGSLFLATILTIMAYATSSGST